MTFQIIHISIVRRRIRSFIRESSLRGLSQADLNGQMHNLFEDQLLLQKPVHMAPLIFCLYGADFVGFALLLFPTTNDINLIFTTTEAKIPSHTSSFLLSVLGPISDTNPALTP